MSLEFLSVIEEVDREIKDEYKPNYFNWLDENYNKLFSEAVNQFDRALVQCRERCDWVSAKIEAQSYKEKILRHAKEYKTEKNISDEDSFFDSLKNEMSIVHE